MSDPQSDDLDRVIDEIASSMTRGEPRRVDAASVRQGITAQTARRSAIPFWLGLAALLLMGLNLTAWYSRRSVTTPLIAQSSTPRPSPSLGSTPSREPLVSAIASPPNTAVAANRRSRPSIAVAPNEPFEGLPRLTVDPIDSPSALTTNALVDAAIPTPRIEIAPLVFAPLVNPQDR